MGALEGRFFIVTGAEDLVVLTKASGFMKWRSTPHTVTKAAI